MKKIILFLLLMAAAVFSVPADNPKAILNYYDNKYQIDVFDFTGKPVEDIYMGYPLLIGYGVQTKNSTAEIELYPNGSILKLKENTFLKIEELQGTKETKSNRFALAKGFVRMVASRILHANYTVKTPSGVLGVRGTDFAVGFTGSGASEIIVHEGQVEIYEPFSRSSMLLSAGEAAQVQRQVLQKMELEMDEIRRRIAEFTFISKAPASVPRRVPDDYYVEYDYFRDIEYADFARFFANENYFSDSDEYLNKYRDYYRSEMRDFQERFEQEKIDFQKFRYQELERYYRYR